LSLQPGQVLSHYRLAEQIGAGGMGVVWKAEDTNLGRDVAIKVLPEDFRGDPERLGRFEREARLLASLNHPNIATIHGLEKIGDIRLLVMELVPGETLGHRLSRGPIVADDALPLFRQMASALHGAHAGGVIHRDLKPANIKITPDGQIKILDFGLAKALGDEPKAIADQSTVIHTRTGVVAGTANYLSPEQLEGKELDGRSDLFQLGMVFFLALAAKHPFAGATSVDTHHAILRGPPQWEHLEGKVSVELQRLIGKLLEKQPDFRYPNAKAVEVDLRTLERDSSSGAAAFSSASIVRPRRRGRTGTRPWIAAAFGLVVIVAGAWWWLDRQPAADRGAVPSRLRPLTEAGGEHDYPRFSPDGSSVVFTSNRGGSWDIWITMVAGGDPLQITDTPEIETEPAWSPDGTRMAFTRYRPDENTSDIYVMPALGGTARKIVDGALDPTWSPDGSWLVFGKAVDGWERVAKVALDAPGRIVAVTEPEDGFFHRDPVWSPDGKWIVYTRSPGGPSGRLMRVSSGGGTAVPLTDDPEGVGSYQPVFSGDGRWVIHSSDRGGAINLWRAPFDGGPPEAVTSGPGSDNSADVSSDGRRIVFVNRRSDTRIVEVDPTGEPRSLVEFERGTGWCPVISPDRRWIAFSRKPAGRRWSIFVMPREGGKLRTLLDTHLNMMWPRFHPDSRSIVFFTWPGRQRVGRVNLDGTGLIWLTPEEVEAGYPAVSPDGEWLAFVRRRPGSQGKEDIVVRPFAGGPERVVIPDATLPDFSPDGRFLAFAASRSFAGRVGVVELDGGEPRWLTSSGTWPTWMPDGEAIAYADERGDRPQRSWIVPLGGGEPRLLSEYRWSGGHYPFDVDPATGGLLTTDQVGERSAIWLAEYE